MRGFVDFFKVKRICFEFNGIHAATNIDADDIRDGFIGNSHSRADCATFTGVHVRHNADFAVFGEFVVTHAANLFASGVLNNFRERNCRIVLASDLFHKKFSFPKVTCSRV